MPDKSSIKKLDIYRDTPVRYLGYTNEIGEAFRSMIGSKWVMVTYGIATTYVLADTASKTKETYDLQNNFKKAAFVATDTLTWQMLASVIVPGITINRTCASLSYCLRNNKRLSQLAKKWTVTSIGLMIIPFIIKPIDNLIDNVLDATLRKYAPDNSEE